jgi:uncharacterized protein
MRDSRWKREWRPFVRALHRDLGYFAVGLTVVYAASGLAVNHIADWDPNFRQYRSTHELRRSLPADDRVAAQIVRERLGIRTEPKEVYRAAPDQLDILFEGRTLHVNPETGRVIDEGQKPRLLLRMANWLHLNRGKKAWTLVADVYAFGLLVLAGTGLFMLPGKRGLRGRGGAFVLVGVAVPLLYVLLSGGPSGGSASVDAPAQVLR